jgi:pilus assembly protein Flp/PilA
MQYESRVCCLGQAQNGSAHERNSMKDILVRLWKEEEGQDLTEYALLLVLLALAATATLNTLATAIRGVFTNAASNLSTAT